MADVKLVGLKKSYGSVDIIKGVDLDIKDGEFVVFVGPSGCGKSTLLRMISGLEEISGGELYIDGRLVNEAQPRERGIAMVFQSYAIFPHMTVRENIGFGLTLAGTPKAEKERAATAANQRLAEEQALKKLGAEERAKKEQEAAEVAKTRAEAARAAREAAEAKRKEEQERADAAREAAEASEKASREAQEKYEEEKAAREAAEKPASLDAELALELRRLRQRALAPDVPAAVKPTAGKSR